MPFRSLRCSSGKFFSGWSAALAIGFALGFAPSARATLTVTPLNGGRSGTTMYFATSAAVLSTPPVYRFAFPGYTMPDPLIDATTDIAGNPNLMLFQIQSDKAFNLTSGQYLVITVRSGYVTDATKPLSIPFAGGLACSATNCQGQNAVIPSGGATGRFYAAKYSQNGGAITIGLYLKTICQDIANAGITLGAAGAIACNNTGAPSVVPVAGTPQTMQLTFSVDVASGSTAPGSNSGDADTGTLTLSLQADGPTLACDGNLSSMPVPAGIYFPGDRQIIVSTGLLSYSLSSTNAAPIGEVVVVAKQGVTAPDLTSTFSGTSNTFYGRLAYGSNGTVEGFVNTAPNALNPYSVGFMIRDIAGVVASNTGCYLSGVQTSQIQGFLSKNRCFIATAAYSEGDNPGLALLREFRDEVLEKSSWGQRFVRWYYDWSPAKAQWLLENPEWRLPVLWALIPIQGLAWAILHPVFGALIVLMGGLILLWSLRRKPANADRLKGGVC